MNKKDILKEVKESSKKERITLTIDPTILQGFQDECRKHEVPVSQVVQEMMRQFLLEKIK